MSGAPIAIGSRGSVLALAQARLVAEAFERQGRATRIVVLETDGDRRAPDTAWGEGAFVTAIERALLGGGVDVAVHSAKDVPTDEDARLHIAAYLPRADPRDALVIRIGVASARLEDLPAGSRVGTDSPRRTGFVLALRPDLVVHPLHGNVDTRLRRLDEGETDALVLACAGLERLERSERISERLDPAVVPPAPGQGAIAVQVRRDDERMIALGTAIDDEPTRLAVEAERTFLRASGGGCRAPIGALATVTNGSLELLGGVAEPDGSRTAIERRAGPAGETGTLAAQLAMTLRAAIRPRHVERFASAQAPVAPPRVASAPIAPSPVAPALRRPRILVTRAAHQAEGLMAALRAHGLDPVHVPTIAVDPLPGGGALDEAFGALGSFAWAVVTSANGARAAVEAIARVGTTLDATCWAAVGAATAAVLEDAGRRVDFLPARASGADLARELPVAPGDRVLVVQGDRADGSLAPGLRARGASVEAVTTYRTIEAPTTSHAALREALDAGPLDAVVFTSGSTVRGLVALAGAASPDVTAIGAICIGAPTALAARKAGFRVLGVPDHPSDADVAEVSARLMRPDGPAAR